MGTEQDNRQQRSDIDSRHDLKNYLDTIIQTSHDGILVVDSEGRFEFGNEAFYRIFGWPADELIGHNFIKVIPPDMHEFILERWEEVQAGKGEPYEVDIVRKNGERRSLLVSHRDMTIAGQRKYCVITKDVTESKQAEEAVRFFSLITEQVSDSIITTNLNFEITHINQSTERLFGYSREEMLGRSPDMLNAESDTEQSRDDIFKTVSSGGIWRGEILNRRKNGSTFPIEATVFPLVDDQGNIFAYASNQRDITVRKLAEQTAARFSSVLEKSLNEIYIFDEETLHFIQVNYGARANLGYSMEELQDLTPLDLKPEFTAAKFAKLIQPLRDGTLEKLEFITVHRRKDGSQYHVEVHLQLMTEGSPVFVAIIRDITERRQAEEALRQSQERFDLAVKGSTDGLWSWSISSGQPRWFSPRAFEMLGYEDGEIPGTHEAWIQLIHPDDRNATMEAVQANIENDVAYDVELRLRTKLGDYRWFRSRGITFRDENGNPVRMAGSIQDIEDRKQAEEELARYRLHLEEMVQMRTEELTEAQETLRKVYRRLLNAGESERKILASNLHDSTGQKLFAMALAVQQTILACQDTPGHEDQIQALRNVSQQCTETIQEIRTICYGLYPPMLELTGLATSLEQLGRSCQPAASFQLECDKALAKARFDPEQEIALFRIAQEAVSNAMRHGHAKNITMSLNQHDGELAMAVSDDGVGFDTASQLGKGLGLRSMTERALAVGGTLAITSQPGRTSIEASLPAKPIDTQAT